MARLNVAVDMVASELATGETKTREVVKDYLAAAKGLGVAGADLQASIYTADAAYEWRDNHQVFTGYRVHRQVTVTVRDLARIGALIQQATASGMTQIDPPALDASGAKATQRQGNVNAADGQSPREMVVVTGSRLRSAAGQSNDDQGFSGGQLHYRATVGISFTIMP